MQRAEEIAAASFASASHEPSGKNATITRMHTMTSTTPCKKPEDTARDAGQGIPGRLLEKSLPKRIPISRYNHHHQQRDHQERDGIGNSPECGPEAATVLQAGQ